MTFKTGSIGEFMTWTKRVIGKGDDDETPKRWFDSDATAASTLGTTTSPEAMVKLLSEENLALLRLIAVRKPSSLRELATLAHRKDSNLSRTLRKLREAGIVEFEEGGPCTRAARHRPSRGARTRSRRPRQPRVRRAVGTLLSAVYVLALLAVSNHGIALPLFAIRQASMTPCVNGCVLILSRSKSP